MRKIRELLRLKYELGRSHREIATSLGIANSTVSDALARREVDLRLSATTVEIFHEHRRVAAHLRIRRKGGYAADAAYMPASHRAHAEWTPSRLIAWGHRAGPHTASFFERLLEDRPLPASRTREDRPGTAPLPALKGHAKLHLDATIEDLNFKAPRGLDRSLVLRLASGQWIRDGQTVLVAGATASGKSYLACALGHQACRLGISTRYYRVSRLLDDLTLARGDESYPKLIQRFARTWLLILDDWGLGSLSGQGRHDLLEVLDDRYAHGGTLKGASMRRLYDSTKAVHNTPGHA